VTRALHPASLFADRPPFRPGVGLALGGGFARAFAHLGVLRVFQDQNIPLACLAGSSVGSALAAAYAGGAPLGKMIAACRDVRFRDFAGWHASRLGLADNKRMSAMIHRFFGMRQFEELPTPLAIVATNLSTGDPVVFRQGLLAEAIRASCAFPGLFAPVQVGTRHFADGSLVAPVPTRAARELGANIVVGVSIPLQDGKADAPDNIFQVVSRAVSATHKNQNESFERYADLILYPDVKAIAWDNFGRIDEAIEAGAFSAVNALPQIRRLLAQKDKDNVSEFGKQGELLLAGSLK
jgi:NTE family protein